MSSDIDIGYCHWKISFAIYFSCQIEMNDRNGEIVDYLQLKFQQNYAENYEFMNLCTYVLCHDKNID